MLYRVYVLYGSKLHLTPEVRLATSDTLHQKYKLRPLQKTFILRAACTRTYLGQHMQFSNYSLFTIHSTFILTIYLCSGFVQQSLRSHKSLTLKPVARIKL